MAASEGLEAVLDALFSFIASHVYLTLGALIAIHLSITYLLNSQSRSFGKSKPLKISELYVYPIKSLRGERVSEAVATKNGFAYDRTFMLLQVTAEGYKNMLVADHYDMTQFLTSITLPDSNDKGKGSITVKFVPAKGGETKTLNIPLQPKTDNLEPFEVSMHASSTKAYKMPAEINKWFSSCFGYEVVLAYLGCHRRGVLFEDLKPANRSSSWLSPIQKSLPFLGSPEIEARITFQDCAPYLVVSKTSLADVSARLDGGEEMDITKFRPNIVVEGADEPWEEDYWGTLTINNAEMILKHNCVRCKSINVDYSTAETGTSSSGEALKRLQKDRRVDKGAKWSPVFGRYSFWNPRQGERVFSIGDAVSVTKVNPERTTWTWKNLG